uniref:Trypsin-6 n=1 Tax=Anoplophora glabripennis TaxID=217634 RepID=V5GNK3_ANOGL
MFALIVGLAIALVHISQAAPVDVEPRVVNGTDADIRDFPYMVSVQFNGRHTCGGSIINRYNILTAAHCVTRDLANFTILPGSTSITSGTAVPVEKIIIHQDYSGFMPLYHDIAIVQLVWPLRFNERVQPIRLPRTFDPIPELAGAVLTGWGLNHTDGAVQDILQKVDIIVYADAECEKLHSLSGPTNRITHVCAGVPEGGRGQCNGDSGGPLVVDGTEIGIVSWSVKPCTVQGFPGVYVKVSSYIDWINCHLKRGNYP